MDSEPSDSGAADELHAFRTQWIDFSHRLPSDIPDAVSLWSTVDMALFQLLGKVRAKQEATRS